MAKRGEAKRIRQTSQRISRIAIRTACMNACQASAAENIGVLGIQKPIDAKENGFATPHTIG